MFRVLAFLIGLLVAVLGWNTSVFLAVSEGWFKSAIVDSSSSGDFIEASRNIVASDHPGNFGMILIDQGDIAGRYFMSSGAPVNGSSVFQVASLGKWITAWGVMALVEDGVVDLDRPVSDYLTRWALPDGQFDNSAVTVRLLLSHTAGLGDGLGYDGFAQPESLQSLEDSLTRALDASPGNSGVVKVDADPGSQWSYSGGGYTILQLLIEETSGQPFADFMSKRMFQPLGMQHTSFKYEEASEFGLAENFDLNGNTEPFRWYSALAAASLFTSVDDLSVFLTAQVKPEGQTVLSKDSLELMRIPHASQMGEEIWGLGPMLYAANNQGGYIIGHDGNNEPAINTVARIDPATGDGIVILSTGSDTLATRIAGEWVFWKTGNIDNLMFLMSFGTMLLWMGSGSVAIVAIAAVFGVVRRRQ